MHFDRRATTSASNSKSANVAFGCDLICFQASLHGIVSCEITVVLSSTPGEDELTADGEIVLSPPHATGLPQQPEPAACSPHRPGQFPQGVVEATDLLIAAQKAFPNGSSAQAKQFDGSPEHDASMRRVRSRGAAVIGNIEFTVVVVVRRRSGTAGWYAGRFSRIDEGVGVKCVDASSRISVVFGGSGASSFREGTV